MDIWNLIGQMYASNGVIIAGSVMFLGLAVIFLPAIISNLRNGSRRNDLSAANTLVLLFFAMTATGSMMIWSVVVLWTMILVWSFLDQRAHDSEVDCDKHNAEA